MEQFSGRIAVQQRVLPEYRAAFFDLLAEQCAGGLAVFAGQPLPKEAIAVASQLNTARLKLVRNWHFLDPGSPYYLCWQPGITRWLEIARPQVLVVEANPRTLSTRLAVRWMHAHSRPVLGWGLGAPPLQGAMVRVRQWERQSFLQSLDGWIAYSQRGADQYRALGLNPQRIFVAGNAVARRPQKPARRNPPLPPAKPLVLFVGRLQRRKRIDLLLQACALLPGDLQPRLWIVGDGPDRAEMEAQARVFYPQAEFLGARRGADLEACFAKADLFVLPGTGGLAVQQAMTHALPVIVARGDGTQDDLVRPANGWLIAPDDLGVLVQTLSDALSDPQRLPVMGAESFRIVSDEVSLEHMVDTFIQAARAVMADRVL